MTANEQGLGAGGASTAARTGAKLASLHKLSGELLPRLRQTQVTGRSFWFLTFINRCIGLIFMPILNTFQDVI